MMQTISFGSTGRQVSAVGLGGEGVLRTYGRSSEAEAVIRAAIEQGITYFDSARVYSDSELYYGAIWGRNPALRKSIFQTSKSAARDKEGAMADLHGSLKRLQTDYLDLWQIHDVRTEEDLRAIDGPGGALEAFVAAKQAGKVRHIGVTGHHDPYILSQAVAHWPVDSVLLPVNPVEEILGGFLTQTLPTAREKGIGVIGMKVLGASHYILPKLALSPERLIRFAMSHQISLPIVGCATPEEVRILAGEGKRPQPLAATEKNEIMAQLKPYAAKLAFYRAVR